jgi:hypothetical protein
MQKNPQKLHEKLDEKFKKVKNLKLSPPLCAHLMSKTAIVTLCISVNEFPKEFIIKTHQNR